MTGIEYMCNCVLSLVLIAQAIFLLECGKNKQKWRFWRYS